MSNYFELAKNMIRAYVSSIKKNIGCDECDALPDNEMCLDHRIEQKDWEISAAMLELERLKQEKEKQEHEKF